MPETHDQGQRRKGGGRKNGTVPRDEVGRVRDGVWPHPDMALLDEFHGLAADERRAGEAKDAYAPR